MLRELERLLMQGYKITLSADAEDGELVFTVDVRNAMRDIASAVIVTAQHITLSEAIAEAYQQTPERE